MLDIITKVAGAINPAFSAIAPIVDKLGLSPEKKTELDLAIEVVKKDVQTKMLDYESKLVQVQSDVIIAEANSGSWLKQSWRPIVMLTFLVLIVADAFGWLANPLSEDVFSILEIGLGGYIVGRSAEKIVPQVMKGMKK